MTAALLKRDLLLVRKYWIFFLVFITAGPAFIISRMESVDDLGVMGLLVVAVVIIIVSYSNICVEEEQYPGAEILLFCAPISRKSGVLARYLLLFLLFLPVAFFYQAAGFVTGRGMLSWYQIIQAMAVMALVMDVFIPMVYALGIGRLQYVMMFIVMGTSFGGSLLTTTSLYQKTTAYLESHPSIMAVGIGVLCVAASIISCCVSMRIYSRKELKG